MASPADQLLSSTSSGTPPTSCHTPAGKASSRHAVGTSSQQRAQSNTLRAHQIMPEPLCLAPGPQTDTCTTASTSAHAPTSPPPPPFIPPTCVHVKPPDGAVVAACQQTSASGPQPLEAADVVPVGLKHQHTIVAAAAAAITAAVRLCAVVNVPQANLTGGEGGRRGRMGGQNSGSVRGFCGALHGVQPSKIYKAEQGVVLQLASKGGRGSG